MKKSIKIISTLTLIVLASVFLVSCKSDFTEYAGVYQMTGYTVEETDVTYDFKEIDKYEIELTPEGYAIHTLKLGVMEKEESFSNNFDISEKKNEIYFYIKDGLVVINKETWDFTNNIITMNDLTIPIVDEPNPDNDSHFVIVTITFELVISK